MFSCPAPANNPARSRRIRAPVAERRTAFEHGARGLRQKRCQKRCHDEAKHAGKAQRLQSVSRTLHWIFAENHQVIANEPTRALTRERYHRFDRPPRQSRPIGLWRVGLSGIELMRLRNG